MGQVTSSHTIDFDLCPHILDIINNMVKHFQTNMNTYVYFKYTQSKADSNRTISGIQNNTNKVTQQNYHINVKESLFLSN